MEEITPLVPNRSAEWQPAHHHQNNDPRRRHSNNQIEEEEQQYDYEFVHHEDATAKDRARSSVQGMWNTIGGMVAMIRGQARANVDLATSCSPLGGNNNNSPPAEQYYEDTFNDEPWTCSFGTEENDGIWLNVHDRVGTIMASIVWVLVVYSGVTVGLLSQHNHLSPVLAKTYFTICALALSAHAKTTFTDPGAIPQSAVPVDVYTPAAHAMCSRCQSYKPPGTHHCRICDRCISGMDHHCPWMNNCVGTGNLKHFILFLCYTWTASAFALLMFGWNYFFCSSDICTFSPVLTQLVRVMTVLCVGTLIFTSSMLTNVTFGVMTGIGTIDRLKMKADDTWGLADDEPMELRDIFGIGDYWTWCLPFFDPVFEDFDLALGYSSPQRLLRERV